jgi:hypothetical protein
MSNLKGLSLCSNQKLEAPHLIHLLQTSKLDYLKVPFCSGIKNFNIPSYSFNLKEINFSYCNLSDLELANFVFNCQQLMKCFLNYTNVNKLTFMALSEKCNDLNELQVCHCYFSEEEFAPIKNCSKLKVLKISSGSDPFGDGILNFLPNGIEKLARPRSGITDKGLVSLQEKRSLTSLNLLGIPDITDNGLIPLLQTLKLKEIKFGNSTNLSNITDLTLEQLALCSPRLTSLCATNCCFTDQGMEELVLRCSSLKRLSISTSVHNHLLQPQQQKEKMLGAKTTRAIGSYCKQLEKLFLTCWINNYDLFDLLECRHLKVLSIGGCDQVDNKGLADVLDYFPHLKELCIRSSKINSKGLSLLQKKLPHLKLSTSNQRQ